MQKVNKIICIETFPFSPHIETSVEIACDLKKNKNNVNFFWSGYDLPWQDWDLPFYKKLLGMSYDYKIKKIEELLRGKNISCISPFELNTNIKEKIYDWSNKFNEKNKLEKYFYKSTNLGIGVKSSMISIFKNKNFLNNIGLIKKSLNSSAIIYERTRIIIEKYNPNLLVTFNNRFSLSKPIIEAANLYGIPVWRHERGSNFKKYEIFKGKDVHDLDERSKNIYSLWSRKNKKKEKIARKYFLNNTIGKEKDKVGTNFLAKENRKIKIPENRKIITFFCSTDYEYEAVSTDYRNFIKNKKWIKQEEAIKSAVKVIKKISNAILYIKDHPHYSSGESYNPWEKYEIKNKIIYFNRKENLNSFDLLKKSDVVLTFGSTMAVDAIYHGKPSISFRKHFFSGSNLLLEPKDDKELLKLIQNSKKFKKINQKKCYPYGYYMSQFGIKFKYYKPINYFKGNLFNKSINHYGVFLNAVNSIFKFF